MNPGESARLSGRILEVLSADTYGGKAGPEGLARGGNLDIAPGRALLRVDMHTILVVVRGKSNRFGPFSCNVHRSHSTLGGDRHLTSNSVETRRKKGAHMIRKMLVVAA